MFNLLSAGAKVEKVIKAVQTDLPELIEIAEEIQTVIAPLEQKMIADMVARGVVSQAEVAAAEATLAKVVALEKKFAPELAALK